LKAASTAAAEPDKLTVFVEVSKTTLMNAPLQYQQHTFTKLQNMQIISTYFQIQPRDKNRTSLEPSGKFLIRE